MIYVSIIAVIVSVASFTIAIGGYFYNQDREKRKIIVDSLAILYRWLITKEEVSSDGYQVYEAYVSLKVMLLSSKDIDEFDKISKDFYAKIGERITILSNEYSEDKLRAFTTNQHTDELAQFVSDYIKLLIPVHRLLLLFLFVNCVSHLFNNNKEKAELEDKKELQRFFSYKLSYFLGPINQGNDNSYTKLLDQAVISIISDMKNPFLRLFNCCKGSCKKWIDKFLSDKNK